MARPIIIISSKPGQLGNRLVMYGHFIAFAAEHNLRVYNPALDEYANLFEGSAGSLLSVYPPSNGKAASERFRKYIYHLFFYLARIVNKLNIANSLCKTIYLNWDQQVDLDRIEIFSSKVNFVQGWLFRTPENVEKHKQVIKNYFTPLTAFNNRVKVFLENARSSCDKLIGVHIRHGDYQHFMNGKYFYTFEKYHQILQDIRTIFPQQKVRFCICSNVPVDAEKFNQLDIIKGPGSAVEDMYVLSGCDYLVGPPSTFTIWASFYGEKPLYQIEDPERKIQLESFRVWNNL